MPHYPFSQWEEETAKTETTEVTEEEREYAGLSDYERRLWERIKHEAHEQELEKRFLEELA